MLSLLIKVIPLDLASTLSPGIFALAVVILGGKWHSKARTSALFLGVLIVGIAVTVLGFSLGKNVAGNIGGTLSSAIVDLILGAVFIVFGIKSLFSKEREIKQPQTDPGYQIFKWLIIGIIISATNLDAVFLNFAAAKEVGGSIGIREITKVILLAVNVFFFTLPVTLPLFFYFIAPKTAKNILENINHFVLKYNKTIMFILFMIFGVLLTYRGLIYFI